MSTVVQENATGVRVVRAFGREKFEMDRFREKNDIFAKLWIRLGTLSGLYWGVGDLITGFQVVAVIVLGTIEAVHGTISVGEFIAFASYNTTLVWPIRGLGRILSDMSKAGVSFERVDYIIRAEEEAYTCSGRKEEYSNASVQAQESENAFDIRFEHVNFAYESGKEVLSDVHFSIPQGHTFGILGGTGSGKSTIVQLLTRLYELEDGQGRICIGGKDIREIPLEQLRKYVGMVLQEPFLYSRTIRENIVMGKPDASEEEVVRAAKASHAHGFIKRLPNGYDTVIGEDGGSLSQGQKQLLCIARVMLCLPPMLILDEATSSIDTRTELRIQKAFSNMMTGRTSFIVAHRLSTIQEADVILVMKDGHIIEQGDHEELLKKNGFYATLYNSQFAV